MYYNRNNKIERASAVVLKWAKIKGELWENLLKDWNLYLRKREREKNKNDENKKKIDKPVRIAMNAMLVFGWLVLVAEIEMLIISMLALVSVVIGIKTSVFCWLNNSVADMI